MKKLNKIVLNKVDVNQSFILKKNELKHIMGGYRYACWMRSESTDYLQGVYGCNGDPTWCENACSYDSMGRSYCICI